MHVIRELVILIETKDHIFQFKMFCNITLEKSMRKTKL